jgi:hypothetical protein
MDPNQYLVQPPFVSDFPPSGPDPWYRPAAPLEPVAEGPVDAEFARWWRLNGENMPGYVARCRNFVRDRLTTGVLHLRHELHSDQRAFDRDLACLIHDIREWMFENSRVTFGLERLQDAPAFTSKERREFNAEMALYRRADAGRRLVKAHFDRLDKLQLVDDAQLIEPRLNALIRELEVWLT